MIELDRFEGAPPSYVAHYGHLFKDGASEFAQRYGNSVLKLARCVDYVDGMPHSTWKLFARLANGRGEAEWMGPIISVSHVDGHEMVYVEDMVDSRIPSSLTLNPQAVLNDVLFERSYTHPADLHFSGDFDAEDSER